jgi:MoaA/NifB/PqqE/SkfB family radical SAM enzyme
MDTRRSLVSKAFDLLRYARAVRERRLLRVAIYVTERCNSRCRTCGVWRKKDPQDMPMEVFRGVLDSVGGKVRFTITGGEPLLHPQIEDIFGELKRNGCSYDLTTNGILSERLVELTKRYGIPDVQVSCDGTRDIYKRIRGVDNYENIAWLLGELSPITRVNVNYVVSPWNSRGELLAVKKLCDRLGAGLLVSVYGEFEYWGTGKAEMREIYRADDLESFPRSQVLRLYGKWARGELHLPCHNVRISCDVVPDGTVYVCSHRMGVLGNVRERMLEQVWQSDTAKRVQAEYGRCNGCWATCYRNLDVALALLNPGTAVKVLC